MPGRFTISMIVTSVIKFLQRF